MLSIELNNLKCWNECSEFYTKKIDMYEGMSNFYYKMRLYSQDKAKACNVEIDYLQQTIKEGE